MGKLDRIFFTRHFVICKTRQTCQGNLAYEDGALPFHIGVNRILTSMLLIPTLKRSKFDPILEKKALLFIKYVVLTLESVDEIPWTGFTQKIEVCPILSA